MSRRVPKPARCPLRLEPLEGRDAPAANFKIASLTANNATAVQDSVTGSDKGGIALSGSQVFVTGQTTTGRFNSSDLTGGAGVGRRYDALVSNLRTGAVYVLGKQDFMNPGQDVPLDDLGGTVSSLLELDPATGALTGNKIALSFAAGDSISLFSNSGIFSGYDRVLLHPQDGNVFEIDLTAGNVGKVTKLVQLNTPTHTQTNSWAYWGVAEHFGGDDYIAYVEDQNLVSRLKVLTGASPAGITFFPGGLGFMDSFTVSVGSNRWYFHNQGPSALNPGAQAGTQVVGFADASFVVGDYVVTSTADSGPGTLREAIGLANGAPAPQTVGFDPTVFGPGPGPKSITLGSPIDIQDTVDIVGPGSAYLTVAGSAANPVFLSTTGSPTVSLRGLTLSNPAGLAVGYDLKVAGDVTLSAPTGDVSFSKTLTVSAGTLTVADKDTADLGTTTTVAGTLAAANGLYVGAGRTLSVSGTVDAVTAVAGTLTGAGTLTKDVVVQSGGLFTGSGTVIQNVFVDSGGTVNPAGAGKATLTVNGTFQVLPGGTFAPDLSGPGGNDLLVVGGAVDLGPGTNFTPNLTFSPPLGTTFPVIQNNGNGAVLGLLNGTRDGAGLKAPNGTLLLVEYQAGSGNDVSLVANTAPSLNPKVPSRLSPVLEDTSTAANRGTAVDDLVGTGGLYTDPDAQRSGMAVTGLDTANGTWWFTRNGGTSWTQLVGVGPGTATVVEADGSGQNRLQFRPVADYFGTATLTWKAWDAADGSADGATGVDATGGGGNAAFSTATATSSIDVLPVNDAPVPAAHAFTTDEDTPLVVAAAGVLGGATDAEGDSLTATVLTQPAHGVLTLTPDGSFTYTPAQDFGGSDGFLYKVNDGHGGTAVGAVALTVTPKADDRLEVVTSPGSATFTENPGGAVPRVVVDPGVQVGLALEGDMTGASVQITSGFVKGKDFLEYVVAKTFPIQGKYNSATGILTLTGTASPAKYQEALRLVTYYNPSPLPVDGFRKMVFVVKDAPGVGHPASRLVKVVGVNTGPTLAFPPNTPAVNYKAGKPAVGVGSGLKLTDVDNTYLAGATVTIGSGFKPGDVLSVSLKAGVSIQSNANGVLVLTGRATVATYLAVLQSVKFASAAGQTGTRRLDFQATDGDLPSAVVSRNVNVTA